MAPDMTFSDLPESIRRPLTVGEVAAVAGVERKVVNRLIDDGALPTYAVKLEKLHARLEERRMVHARAVPMAYFLATTGSHLSSDIRKTVLILIESCIRDDAVAEPFELGALKLDVRRVLTDAFDGMCKLSRAEADVTEDHDVRGGMPVMKGTRIGVYEIADYAASEPLERVLEDFPSMTEERIENALIYAKAHPLSGRPRKKSGPPKGARLVSSTKVDLSSL